MLGLWLTTIGAMAIFFATLYFFFRIIRDAVNAEDSNVIDKLPDEDSR